MKLEDKKDYCCRDFQRALRSGTDNEGYGALINIYDGCYNIGSVGQFYYCPFCGKKVTPSSDEGKE